MIVLKVAWFLMGVVPILFFLSFMWRYFFSLAVLPLAVALACWLISPYLMPVGFFGMVLLAPKIEKALG